MKEHRVRIIQLLLIGFALYLIILTGGFFGVKYGWTNTSGTVDKESDYFQSIDTKIAQIKNVVGDALSGGSSQTDEIRNTNYCMIRAIGQFYPVNARQIVAAAVKTGSDALTYKMIVAVNLRLLNNSVFQNNFNRCETDHASSDSLVDLQKEFAGASGPNAFPWIDQPEWQTIAAATLKDKTAIDKAGEVAGIEPRLIVASMIVEQLRLFNSEREVFKQFFEPLKILGNSNKISLGIMGIKEATATEVKANLKNPASPYYLGPNYTTALDGLSGSVYDQLTNEGDNHYASYLYGALYLKQFITQWKKAGHDIEYRPEILGTLFNVGFPQSKPNSTPKVGGSVIDVGSGQYSFGSLSYEFYYSGELTDAFPYEMN